ncbi:hypothetical protein EDB80DRAFT_687405 [Ilyonectria destructans]|nr:hypothetical protein EDB80DRAFT_687405 [Ilyonectria destructans]
MSRLRIQKALATLCLIASVVGNSIPRPPPLPIVPTTIHEFGPGIWLENLFVRHNGDLLVNSQSAPELYRINPQRPERRTLIHTFPSSAQLKSNTGLGGIVETTPDTFALIVGDLNHTTVTGTKGSFSVWTINLQGYPRKAPKVRKITSIPESSFLNGLTTLDDPRVILACDSFNGKVYRIDTTTGEYKVVIQPDETTLSPSGMDFFVGIDGIRTYRPRHSKTTYLYYNNFMGEAYYRVPIDSKLATPLGPPETLAVDLGSGLDDLDIDGFGATWMAVGAGRNGSIVRLGPSNDATVVAEGKNTTDLFLITAVRRGRTAADCSKFYYSTGLGKVGYIDAAGWV